MDPLSRPYNGHLFRSGQTQVGGTLEQARAEQPPRSQLIDVLPSSGFLETTSPSPATQSPGAGLFLATGAVSCPLRRTKEPLDPADTERCVWREGGYREWPGY